MVDLILVGGQWHKKSGVWMSGIESEQGPLETGVGVPPSDQEAELRDCCVQTIDMHAKNNPMMVCGQCKQIIKCFDDEKAFRNYKKFCLSRHRKILATQYSPWWVIVFKSYDTFTA